MTEHTDSVTEAVESALNDAFPERDVDDVRPAGPSWNDLNETVRVDFTGGETFFLKIATDGDGSRIIRESAVIDYVSTHCNVPVPSVIASQTTGEIPYLVTAPMRTRSLAPQWVDLSTEERASILRQIGAALAEINSQQFEQHGHVVGGSADGLTLDTGSWTDILSEGIDEMREIASSDRFEHYYDEVIAAVKANRERLDDAPATLVHNDPSMPNIFRSETTLGFVDWELAHVGDPAHELHRARDQLLASRDPEDDEQLVGALHDGYQRRAGSLPPGFEERAPVYDAVRFLGTVGFFDKSVLDVEGSAAEYATWVEAEMDRRLNKLR